MAIDSVHVAAKIGWDVSGAAITLLSINNTRFGLARVGQALGRFRQHVAELRRPVAKTRNAELAAFEG
jgi:hypothetical protein